MCKCLELYEKDITPNAFSTFCCVSIVVSTVLEAALFSKASCLLVFSCGSTRSWVLEETASPLFAKISMRSIATTKLTEDAKCVPQSKKFYISYTSQLNGK